MDSTLKVGVLAGAAFLIYSIYNKSSGQNVKSTAAAANGLPKSSASNTNKSGTATKPPVLTAGPSAMGPSGGALTYGPGSPVISGPGITFTGSNANLTPLVVGQSSNVSTVVGGGANTRDSGPNGVNGSTSGITAGPGAQAAFDAAVGGAQQGAGFGSIIGPGGRTVGAFMGFAGGLITNLLGRGPLPTVAPGAGVAPAAAAPSVASLAGPSFSLPDVAPTAVTAAPNPVGVVTSSAIGPASGNETNLTVGPPTAQDFTFDVAEFDANVSAVSNVNSFDQSTPSGIVGGEDSASIGFGSGGLGFGAANNGGGVDGFSTPAGVAGQSVGFEGGFGDDANPGGGNEGESVG